MGGGGGRQETPYYGGVIEGDEDYGESYYTKEIFANKSNPDDLEYRTGRTTSFRMTTVSLIRST